MLSVRRQARLRIGLALSATALLAFAFWSHRTAAAPVQAAPVRDPNLLWTIGRADNSGDEFAPGAAAGLVYDTAAGAPERDWRQRQDAAAQSPPVYRIRFRLDQPPAAPLGLHVDVFFLGAAPGTVEINVNGRPGRFRVQPDFGPDLDERQANIITHARQALRVPLDPSLLRADDNEIALAWYGADASVYYDRVSLARSAGAAADLEASVEPTIFYRGSGEDLREIAGLVVRHPRPLGRASVSLNIGEFSVTRELPDDGCAFGERTLLIEVPALSAPAPYRISLRTPAGVTSWKGDFRPEKRWRIFAGLKIHNDIGYTDLQPHVQELDDRNADAVLDLVSRGPLYKFNFETGWLMDNYLHARRSARVRELMQMAARGRVGVNAMYLNLMTGLSTGEELYRSLYFSQSLHRQYGVTLKFACLTDAPSHSWFVPTLLADAGIPGFANGSNQTRAPLLQNSNLNEDSPFYWEGPDGRRVMTWFARSYLQLDRLVGEHPSVEHLARTVPQFLARYRRAGYPVDAVLLYGLFTDNAGFRDGDAPILEEWNRTYAFPKIIPATDADYYAYLAAHFADKLPTFRGDAGSYWEDGAASSAAETAINRDTQRLLPAVETAAAVASLFQPRELYPAPEFREAWKNLLFYDEHTWGAHNSIAQPARRFVTDQWEFKRAYALRAHWSAKDLMYRSFNRLVQNISLTGPTFFVFNPNSWPRAGAVELELDPGRALVDLATGRDAAAEEISRQDGSRVLRLVTPPVPGLGYKAYGVRRLDTPAPPPETAARGWSIESRYYRAVLDPATGAIAELYDKELGRNLVDRQAPYKLNELLYISGGERSRILQDLATLEPPRLEITGPGGAQVAVNTGRRIVVRASASHVPSLETEVILYDDLKRVDIVNRLRKEETRAKEAVYFAFPFAVSPPELAYQIQNTWVRPNTDQLPGACRDWFTTQNLVVARDSSAAIAWATPDAPLITLTDINRGAWLKQLPIRNGWIFSYVMNNYWFTNYRAAQGGEMTFRYSLTSARTLAEPELARFSVETRSPLIGYEYYDTGNVHLVPGPRRMPAASGAFFTLDSDHAEVSAFKEAEDGNGYILRLRETSGQAGTARFTSPVFPLAGAWLANGVEENQAPLAAGAAVEIPLKARAYTTVRLVFRSLTVAAR
ncbi:MAG TPA: glycosyl hydrolase-related protein [Bryobacteraceae bacterium]|nr:glycosyl hydrolase-related protein [Bryobacteraceae bacterium]